MISYKTEPELVASLERGFRVSHLQYHKRMVVTSDSGHVLGEAPLPNKPLSALQASYL